MNTRKVLAFIALLLVLLGFSCPWLELYGPVSGIDAILISAERLFTGTGWTSAWFTLLIFIPILALFISYITYAQVRLFFLIVVSVIVIDLLAGFAFWGILNYVYWKHIWYGYPIMITGIVIFNSLVIQQCFIKKKASP